MVLTIYNLFLLFPYSCSQLSPALGVFRWYLSQFYINSHEILQAFFSTIPAPTLKISKFRPFDM